jgi:hypothetical protein
MTKALLAATATTASVNMGKVESDFMAAMGDGPAASKHLATLINAVTTNGNDTRNIASIVNRLKTAGDPNGSKAVRSIFASCFPDASIKKAKDSDKLVIKLNLPNDGLLNVDSGAIERLADGVSKGLSLRATLVEHVQAKDKTVTEYDLAANAFKQAKAFTKQGVSEAAAIAAISAAFKRLAEVD